MHRLGILCAPSARITAKITSKIFGRETVVGTGAYPVTLRGRCCSPVGTVVRGLRPGALGRVDSVTQREASHSGRLTHVAARVSSSLPTWSCGRRLPHGC